MEDTQLTMDNGQLTMGNSQLVPPGYKQTEVGVIPEDWEVVRLGHYLSGTPTYGINAPAMLFDSRFPTYLRITDITEDGRFDETNKTSVNHPAAMSYVLEIGDLVFARTGASVGKSYLYDPKDGQLVFAGFLIRFHPDVQRLVPAYLRFFVQTHSYWNWVKTNSMRSGQPGINSQEFASLLIPLPPTLAEQEAIAAALSDADALIEALEQLIAKKRQVKQGAMQELLTGKRRLPGFSGEWEVKRIGEIADMQSGGTPLTTVAAYYDGNIPWVSISDMTKSSKIISKTDRNLTEAGLANSAAHLFPTGTVLYAMYASIGECSIAGIPLCSSQAILGIRTKANLHNEFLYYYLFLLKPVVKLMGQQGTQSNLNAGMVRGFQLCLPPLPEQTAIAAILSDMDAEIAALEEKLAKARQVKQGMMQMLLTGKVRLV